MRTLDEQHLPQFAASLIGEQLITLNKISLADIVLDGPHLESDWDRVDVFLDNVYRVIATLTGDVVLLDNEYFGLVRVSTQLSRIAAVFQKIGDVDTYQDCLYLSSRLASCIGLPHADYNEIANVAILHLFLGENHVWESWLDYLKCEILEGKVGVDTIDAFTALCRILWSLVDNAKSSPREVFKMIENDYIRVILRLSKHNEDPTQATAVMEHYRSQAEK